MTATRRDRLGAMTVFAAGAAMLGLGLGAYGLWDPDEGRHAAIARELFAATTWHGWLIPSHNFAPYYDKPILYYWLTALAYGLLGASELGARIVSALAAFGTLGVVYAWTATVASPRAARHAVLILASTTGFVALGRYGSLDTLLTGWITLGVAAADRALADPARVRWFAVTGAAAGLGMLTKGLVAPIFVGGIPLVHALATGRPLPRRVRPWVAAGATFALVASPWYAAVALVDATYLREFFLVHHVERFAADTPAFHRQPWWYFGAVIPLLLLPWGVLLPATLAMTARERDPVTRYGLWWAGLVVLFFSCSRSKLATYALPAVPPLAILTARALERLPDAGAMVRRAIGIGLALLAVAAAIAAGAATTLPSPERWRPVLDAARPLAPMAPLAASIPLALWWWRRDRTAMTGLALATLAAFLTFYLRVAPAVSVAASDAPDAELIALRPEAPIVGFGVTPASLLFYTGRPIVREHRPRRVRRILAAHPFVWIVTTPRHEATLRQIANVFPWETTGRHVLFATGPIETAAR